VIGIKKHDGFNLSIYRDSDPIKFLTYSVEKFGDPGSKYELLRLDSLWSRNIDCSISVAMNQIVSLINTADIGSAQRYESKFVEYFDLKKVSSRVFFANSNTVYVNENMVSFLGAFSNSKGEKTARLCMHKDQSHSIQEMLMIHSEPIITGPLRQNNNSSVSYHMIRGAIEITLHHGGSNGDEVHTIECRPGEPSSYLAIRVPANVFRTIRTLTSSAVFIEVQSGPFKNLDTHWKKSNLPKRVLVIGATGLLGHKIFEELTLSGSEVVGTFRNGNVASSSMVRVDLLDQSKTIETIAELGSFETVVFAAGGGGLAASEREPEVSKFLNVTSAISLCEYFLKTGCSRFVYLSSGRVFQGDKAFVSADEHHNPNSELGRQKSEVEKALLSMSAKTRVVRLAKVLGLNDSLLDSWTTALLRGKHIEAITDIAVSPISLANASQAVLEVIHGEYPQITQLSATDEISYFEIALEVAKFLEQDKSLIVPRTAKQLGEIAVPNASFQLTNFRSITSVTSIETVRQYLSNRIET
jgi:cupin fold WbuC family metalloprotein